MKDQDLKENVGLIFVGLKELEYAEQLVSESKFNEALQVLTELMKNEKITLETRVSCLFLQSRILMWQGKYNDCYKISEQIYKESPGLGKDLRTVEALSLMSLSLIILRKFKRGFELVHQAENRLKSFSKESSSRYVLIEALIAQNKGYYYLWSRENIVKSLKYLEESLSLRKQYGGKVEIAMGFYGVANVLIVFKGELDHAIEYLKEGLVFANESGNKWPVIMILNLLGDTYELKGELDRAFGYYKKGLKVAKEIDNTQLIIGFLVNITDIYIEKGELELAFDFLEQSMVKGEELGSPRDMILVFMNAIDLFLAKDDLNQAQQYFQRLEQLSKQFNDKETKLIVLLSKALLLKASPRFRDKLRAEEKLKKMLKEENLSYRFEVITITHLCELLFTELRVTNEIEIIKEITPLITRLLMVTEKSNSYSSLCELYLLQAKFALLELDLNAAKRKFIQATQLAKRYDLNLLEKKISNENKEFIEKLDIWEHLVKINAPLSDRLNIIRLDQQFGSIIRNRTILNTEIKEEKVTIHKEKKICLVCRGEVLKHSYICECGSLYCESCADAISNIENVCWACNSPIDLSKTIKLYNEGREKHIDDKV
ncbi:MAG: hypothetical protein ACW99L_11990 [Promethearchaeota archaeon]|jgi:tetratricopeptide (TPR) repeat protein